MSGFTPTGGDVFAESVGTVLSGVFRDSTGDAIARFDLPLDFDLMLPEALAYGKERGAEMIGKKFVDGHLVDNPNAELVIDDYTRDRANALLQDAVEEGWSPQKFASELEDSGLFGEGRAERIARTEVAIAENRGLVNAVKAAGEDKVYVQDGDDDEECADANGQVWTVEEAEDEPISHPNCTRSFRPLTREEREEEED